MFHNEAGFIKEWIDYHLCIGFDHVFLTNDNSDDNFLKIVRPYIKKGWVTLENARQDLNFYQKEEWHKNQILKKKREHFQWIAFLDSDEFIFCKENLKSFLSQYKACAGIVMSSFFYGTSNVEDLQENDFLIDRLTYRFVDDYHEHRSVKSIVQTGFGLRFFNKNPHYPQYSPMARLCWANKERFKPAERKIIREPLSLNHYWYRTEKFYREVKRPRRIFFEGGERKAHIEKWHKENANAVKDDRLAIKAREILRFREELDF